MYAAFAWGDIEVGTSQFATPARDSPNRVSRENTTKHSDRERQLRFSRFPPFVESIRGNQAAALYECLTEGWGFIDGLSSGINGPVSNLLIFCPMGDQSPAELV
jgi:hypothetical protein